MCGTSALRKDVKRLTTSMYGRNLLDHTHYESVVTTNCTLEFRTNKGLAKWYRNPIFRLLESSNIRRVK